MITGWATAGQHQLRIRPKATNAKRGYRPGITGPPLPHPRQPTLDRSPSGGGSAGSNPAGGAERKARNHWPLANPRAEISTKSGVDILAPLDHPGHARPRLPRRRHRLRARCQTDTSWTDHVVGQRIPPIIRRPPARRANDPDQPARLVALAPTTSTSSPPMPLPTPRTPMITNYGCSTSEKGARLIPVRGEKGIVADAREVWLYLVAALA